MRRPWQQHFSAALLLAAVAFAVGEFLNLMGGAALGAVAFFVALRPLFMKKRVKSP